MRRLMICKVHHPDPEKCERTWQDLQSENARPVWKIVPCWKMTVHFMRKDPPSTFVDDYVLSLTASLLPFHDSTLLILRPIGYRYASGSPAPGALRLSRNIQSTFPSFRRVSSARARRPIAAIGSAVTKRERHRAASWYSEPMCFRPHASRAAVDV